MFFKKFLISSLLLSPAAFAVHSSSDSLLHGAWNLTSFTINPSQGRPTVFCEGASGLIIYEKSGHMSVSINCQTQQSQKYPAAAFGNMLFYAGAYELTGDDVRHSITQSNVPSLIGKNLVRHLERLDENTLVLTGPLGSNGDTLRIEWQRAQAPDQSAQPEEFALLSYLKVKPGLEEAFKKEVATIVKVSRSESQNLAWFVQQSLEDSTEFVFYTRWPNQAALNAHLNSKPLADYIQRSSSLLAEKPKLVRFKPLDLLDSRPLHE